MSASVAPESRATDALVRSGTNPSVRYVSGLTVYEEALVGGRWMGRYWSSNGRIRPDIFIDGPNHERVRNLPIEAFELEIDGQALNSNWEWVDARSDQDSKTGRRVSVTLRHLIRPIDVTCLTRLDGTSVVTRWLEIRNRGAQPAALARIQPFAGLLWRMEDVRANLGDATRQPFTLGRFGSATHLYEGCFAWEAIPNGTLKIEGRRGR